MAERRQGGERGEAEATGGGEAGQAAAEAAHQRVGETSRREAVQRPAAGVAGQYVGIAGVLRFSDRFHQFPGIAQGKVESLAGDRVQGLRGVAEPDAALRSGVEAQLQGQRVAGAIPDAR